MVIVFSDTPNKQFKWQEVFYRRFELHDYVNGKETLGVPADKQAGDGFGVRIYA